METLSIETFGFDIIKNFMKEFESEFFVDVVLIK